MADGASNRQRRSIRLPHYDCGDAGTYFITFCVQNRTCSFGDVIDGSMVLNELGKIGATEWRPTSEIRPDVALDEFVVMPNHFHAIVTLKSFRRGVSHTLGAIVGGFKGLTTKSIAVLQGRHGQSFGNATITNMWFVMTMSCKG